jgi:hypothetical protein
MRPIVIALAALAMAAPSLADQNPDIRIYLDADPPDYVHQICPEPMTTFEVYVCLDCFGEEGGLRGVIFRFERTFGGYLTTKIPLLGSNHLGDPEDETYGWTIVSDGDCVYPDENGIVVVGLCVYLYVGPPGTLDLARVDVSWEDTLDCDMQNDFFCVYANLGVCVPPNPGQGCDCLVTPVADVSWGSIKALYQ